MPLRRILIDEEAKLLCPLDSSAGLFLEAVSGRSAAYKCRLGSANEQASFREPFATSHRTDKHAAVATS